MAANDIQPGGEHYRKYGKLQPWDLWSVWQLDPFQATVVKYTIRVKGDTAKQLEDIDKAIHTLQKYKEEIAAGYKRGGL